MTKVLLKVIKMSEYFRITGNYRKSVFTLAIFYLFLFLICTNSYSKPVGKGLFCFSENSASKNYNSFRAFKFETDKSVRVVTIKEKNNNLKIISKQTPYLTDAEKIEFKIKFIWYGNIYFENFKLDRKTLTLRLSSNNKDDKFSCNILKKDFMKFINKKKDEFQILLEKDVFKSQI
tara:strand:+ start:250 stop:777 length:528 start_codon:yes stop_codon:yes gene_type:complete